MREGAKVAGVGRVGGRSAPFSVEEVVCGWAGRVARDDDVIAAIEKVEASVVNINTVRFERDTFLHVHPARGLG